MKTTDKDRLLNDVLGNEDYVAFRAALLDEMLIDLRRRGGVKKHFQLLALAACLPIAAMIYLLLPPRTPPAGQPSSRVAVVRTVPLASDQIVTTTAATPVSITQPKVLVVATTKGEIPIVQTASQRMELLTDRQLLELFKGQPVALVTVGPGERRLVLPDEVEPSW